MVQVILHENGPVSGWRVLFLAQEPPPAAKQDRLRHAIQADSHVDVFVFVLDLQMAECTELRSQNCCRKQNPGDGFVEVPLLCVDLVTGRLGNKEATRLM